MKFEDTIWLLAHSTNPEDRREWAVLYWKSQGLRHEEIAEKWGYSIPWVQRYMTRAYKRFEVPQHFNKYEKFQFLEENVFPLIRKFIANEPDTVKELPSPPEEEIDTSGKSHADSEEDTKPRKIIVDKPKIITIPSNPPRRTYFSVFARLFMLVAVIVSVALISYFWGRGSVGTTTSATNTFTESATFALPTFTLEPTSTFAVISPTNSPIPSATNPPPPTNTAVFIPPADGILFQDNFDTTMSPEWQVFSGSWIVSDGKLTSLAHEPHVYIYQWIALPKPAWKNYVLSINLVHRKNNSYPEVAIAVRNNGVQQIGLEIDSLLRVYWAMIGTDHTKSVPISGISNDSKVPFNSNLEIEVRDDTYTLRVNGLVLQTVTISGYDQGGISLGVDCDDTYFGCPSFDNVKVTYLP